MFSLRRNDPVANNEAMRVVRCCPETQASVDDLVEISGVGEVALKDTDRVVHPVTFTSRANVPEVPIPNEHVWFGLDDGIGTG